MLVLRRYFADILWAKSRGSQQRLFASPHLHWPESTLPNLHSSSYVRTAQTQMVIVDISETSSTNFSD